MCAGFGEGTVGLDPTFCTLLCRAFGCVSFLADLVVCLSVSLELRLPCFLCAFRGSAPERAQ